MAFLKIASLVAFACLAQSYPEFDLPDLDNLKNKTANATIAWEMSVVDSKKSPVVSVNVTVMVYGNLNSTGDHQVVSEFVQDKLSSIQVNPEREEPHRFMYEVEDALPCLINDTIVEVVSIGPNPVRKFAIVVYVAVCGKKKHHYETISMLKSLKPVF